MSKRDRKKRYKPAGQVSVKPVSMTEVGDIFFPELIPLDEEFIKHLASEHGFPLAGLKEMAKLGFKYNPQRDSFMTDPEYEDTGLLSEGGETDD